MVPDPILLSVYGQQVEDSIKEGEGSSGSDDDEEKKSDAVKCYERGETSGVGRVEENSEPKDDRKTGEKGDGSTSSSSLSSSEDEGSVRHRKNASADGTGREGSPVTEDKGEQQE